jgi:hypothetical protein
MRSSSACTAACSRSHVAACRDPLANSADGSSNASRPAAPRADSRGDSGMTVPVRPGPVTAGSSRNSRTTRSAPHGRSAKMTRCGVTQLNTTRRAGRVDAVAGTGCSTTEPPPPAGPSRCAAVASCGLPPALTARALAKSDVTRRRDTVGRGMANPPWMPCRVRRGTPQVAANYCRVVLVKDYPSSATDV